MRVALPRTLPLLASLLLAACSRGAEQRATPATSASGAVASASASALPVAASAAVEGGPSLPVTPVSPGRQGSTVALGTLEGRRVALVADADARAVQVIDQERNAVWSSHALPAAPGQILLTREGKALVALRGGYEVLVLGGRAGGRLGREGSLATAPEPFGLALTPDGSAVLVASARGRRLESFALASRERAFSVKLPREPRAVLVADDGQSAFVSHAAGSLLSQVMLPPDGEIKTIRLDGTSNLPSYMGNHAYRDGAQGFSVVQLGERVFAPQALVNAGLRTVKGRSAGGNVDMFGDIAGPRWPSKSQAQDMYGDSGEDPYPIALQSVAVVKPSRIEKLDGKLKPPGSAGSELDFYVLQPFHFSLGRTWVAEPSSVMLPDSQDAAEARLFNACTLPRAAVADPEQKSLLVACQGHDVLLELDATASDPARHELRRFALPAGPTGVALDPARREAVVFSQYDRALVTVSLGPARPPVGGKLRPHNVLVARDGKKKAIEVLPAASRLDLPPEGSLPASLAQGRKLFHALGDERISADGRACASCHPDGRDDAVTWASPGGPRQTPALAGRLLDRTGPFGWNGAHPSLKVHLEHTFRRLHGKGLPDDELATLIEYVLAMPAPPPVPAQSPQIARGKELFEGSTGCFACHAAPSYTDGLPHDVRSGGVFDTPSLAFIGSTGPYFHDGRYKTLRAMLLDSDGKMGATKALTPDDLDALEAYLETL